MSNIIKGLRASKGFTQEDMASLLKIGTKTYWIKEKNPDLFSVGDLKKIAKILNVKEEIFFKDNMTL